MGLFDLFKKPAKIQDEVFGELTLNTKYLSNSSFLFKPLNTKIYLSIDSNDNNVSEKQRQFFLKIEDNYTVLREKIMPIILDTFKNWKEDFEINEFDKEFPLISLTLPIINGESVNWQICYANIYDDHDFTVFVKDLEPEESVSISG